MFKGLFSTVSRTTAEDYFRDRASLTATERDLFETYLNGLAHGFMLSNAKLVQRGDTPLFRASHGTTLGADLLEEIMSDYAIANPTAAEQPVFTLALTALQTHYGS